MYANNALTTLAARRLHAAGRVQHFTRFSDCPKRVGLPLRSDRFDIAVKQANIADGYFCFLEKTNQNDWVWASYRNVKNLRLEWRVKSGNLESLL
jgi:hypothetical protein